MSGRSHSLLFWLTGAVRNAVLFLFILSAKACRKGVSGLSKIAETVEKLIKSTVEGTGNELWDVRFVKEGASYFLRVFIDKEDGVGIDDCVEVSHAIDPLLDEADPIDVSYCLEVSSPGIERELTRKEHFEKMRGRAVKVGLYKALNGQKEITGTLEDYDGGITLSLDGEKTYLEKGLFSSVRLFEEF